MSAIDQTSSRRNGRRRGIVMAAGFLALLLFSACGHMMMMMGNRVDPPPASEFGFGPRVSSGGLYEATIEPTEPLRVRRMHTVKLSVRTREGGAAEADGAATVDGASIAVDGGMPQHGHGLPTHPRVTRQLAAGTYQVDGVRFNMGGWWELKFRIDSAAGADSVTFNLDL
jgi:hypothetical protein